VPSRSQAASPAIAARKEAAKALLKRRGWSLRSASRDHGGPLSVTFSHLSKVLCTDRRSEALMREIRAIPARSIREREENAKP
jgi:lambda repressor-like predicted transcriptional regulator